MIQPMREKSEYICEGETAAWLASRKCETECVRILAATDRVDWNKGDISSKYLPFAYFD